MNKHWVIIVCGACLFLSNEHVRARDANVFDVGAELRLLIPGEDSIFPYHLSHDFMQGSNSAGNEQILAIVHQTPLEMHWMLLCEWVADMRGWGVWVPYAHLCRGRAHGIYSIQLLLETIERQYPDPSLLAEERRAVLQAIYDEVAEIVRLIIEDEGVLDENEGSHFVDILGLLLRAQGAAFNVRALAFHAILQRFLLEDDDYMVESYIDIWARVLEGGNLPAHHMHEIRRMLLECLREEAPRRVQQAAARATGVLLEHVDLDESLQAELVKYWLDLVFVVRVDVSGIQAVIRGMQSALRGGQLSEDLKMVLFKALLLFREPGCFSQLWYEAHVHLVERSLLDLWAEGLHRGWFSQSMLNDLVPVIMSYRTVLDCPIRTQSVMGGLVGLLHARAEDSTFRQLVYQHLGDILFTFGQRNIVIERGVRLLSELFMNQALSGWERIQIIAYLNTLLPRSTGLYMGAHFVDALAGMLNRPSLSPWERTEMLRLLKQACLFDPESADMRQDDVLGALLTFKDREGGGSPEEQALIQEIVEALPDDEDDLDYDDDDDLLVG